MNARLIRKAFLLLLLAVGLSSCFGSCQAGNAAVTSMMDREAVPLKRMHDRGYLVLREPGTEPAFDAAPDRLEVVYELQETNLSTASNSIGSWLLTGLAMFCFIFLTLEGWPSKPPRPNHATDPE